MVSWVPLLIPASHHGSPEWPLSICTAGGKNGHDAIAKMNYFDRPVCVLSKMGKDSVHQILSGFFIISYTSHSRDMDGQR